MSILTSLRENNWAGYRRLLKFCVLILLLSSLIFLPDIYYLLKNRVYNYLLIGFVIVPLLLLTPTAFFLGRIKIYYFILALISSFTPIALLPVLLINSQVNSEMLGLVLDTNYHEAVELLGWRLILIPFLMILFFIIFIKLSRKLPQRINIRHGFIISIVSFSIFLLVPFSRTTSMKYYSRILENTFKTYYPFRIGDALSYLSHELKNVDVYNKTVKNFSFNAFRKADDSSRKIHLLLIGETARYDHWSINGYSRETSPRLEQEKNLITFSDAVSGGTMTIISVPLIITRADALHYDIHKKERSILEAYKETGYKTFWVSNQSKFGLTGNIGMHYGDADTTIFNGWGSNETNFEGNTDSTLIPMVKNAINSAGQKDVFMVVHMIGSHWRYLLRYPLSFSKFLPVSNRNRMMMGYPSKDIMINEYDNSILYSDYIISSIINLLKEYNAESTLTFVSDHGENLGDNVQTPLYFHGYEPTYYTARVPLFFWASDAYIDSHKDQYKTMRENKDRPVSSADNLFYTILDMSDIGFKGSDSTKSIGSPYFRNSDQKIYGENGRIVAFKDLKK